MSTTRLPRAAAVATLGASLLATSLLAGCGPTPTSRQSLNVKGLAIHRVKGDGTTADRSIRLSWDAAQGNPKYIRITRREGTGASSTLQGSYDPKQTTYTDSSAEPGKTYTYNVTAKDQNDQDIGEGLGENLTLRDAGALANVGFSEPANGATANQDDGVTLKWAAVSGADWYYIKHVDKDGNLVRGIYLKGDKTSAVFSTRADRATPTDSTISSAIPADLKVKTDGGLPLGNNTFTIYAISSNNNTLIANATSIAVKEGTSVSVTVS